MGTIPFEKTGQLLTGDEIQVPGRSVAYSISRFAPVLETAPTGASLVLRVQDVSGASPTAYIEQTILAGQKMATPVSGYIGRAASESFFIRIVSGPSGANAAGYLSGYVEDNQPDYSGAPASTVFTNYSDLKAAIADWLARSDLTTQIPQFIRLAEIQAQRELGLQNTNTQTTGTLIAAQDYLVLPDDCLEPQQLRLDTDPIRYAEIVSPAVFALAKQTSEGGYPVVAMSRGGRLWLAPAPAQNTAYTLLYRGGIAPLSDSNPTGLLLRNNPDLLLYGALLHSAPYLGDDPRVATWQRFYAAISDQVKRQQFRARTGGGVLRMRPDFIA